MASALAACSTERTQFTTPRWDALRTTAYQAAINHELPAAEKAYRQSIQEAGQAGLHPWSVAISTCDLASIYVKEHKYSDGESAYLHAIQLLKSEAQISKPDRSRRVMIHSALCNGLVGFARLRCIQHQPHAALLLYEEALNVARDGGLPDNRFVEIGGAIAAIPNLSEADTKYATSMVERFFPEDCRQSRAAVSRFQSIDQWSKRYIAAAQAFENEQYGRGQSLLAPALAAVEKISRPLPDTYEKKLEQEWLLGCLDTLGKFYEHRKQYRLAADLAERTIAIRKQYLWPDNPALIANRVAVARCLLARLGNEHLKEEGADALMFQSYAFCQGTDSLLEADVCLALAEMYGRKAEREKQLSMLNAALGIYDRVFGDKNQSSNANFAYLALGKKFVEARAYQESMLSLKHCWPDQNNLELRKDLYVNLAIAAQSTRQPSEADQANRQALHLCRVLGGGDGVNVIQRVCNITNYYHSHGCDRLVLQNSRVICRALRALKETGLDIHEDAFALALADRSEQNRFIPQVILRLSASGWDRARIARKLLALSGQLRSIAEPLDDSTSVMRIYRFCAQLLDAAMLQVHNPVAEEGALDCVNAICMQRAELDMLFESYDQAVARCKQALDVLEHSQEDRTAQRQTLLLTIGVYFRLTNQWPEAERYLRRSIALAVSPKRFSQAELIRAKTELFVVDATIGKYDEAQTLFQELFRTGNCVQKCALCETLATSERQQGNRTRAIELYAQALDLLKTQPAPKDTIWFNKLINLAEQFQIVGSTREVENCLGEAEATVSLYPDEIRAARSLVVLASGRGRCGLFAKARSTQARALSLLQKQENYFPEVFVANLLNMSRIVRQSNGSFAEVRKLLQRAMTVCTSEQEFPGRDREIAEIHGQLGDLFMVEHKYVLAEEEFFKVAALAGRPGVSRALVASNDFGLASAYLAQQQFKESEKWMQAAFSQHVLNNLCTDYWIVMSELRRNKAQAAISRCKSALQLLVPAQCRDWSPILHMFLGRGQMLAGDYKEAATSLDQAYDESCHRADSLDMFRRANIRLYQSTNLLGLGQLDLAKRYCHQAVELYAQCAPQWFDARDDCQKTLKEFCPGALMPVTK